MTCLGGIAWLSERLPMQHDGGIRAEDGMVGVLLRHLARLQQRVSNHGIARVFRIPHLVHSRRDRNKRRTDLPQEGTPSGRCRRKNKHILSPNQKGLLHESKRATAPSHISL